jgi:hypothetical protein
MPLNSRKAWVICRSRANIASQESHQACKSWIGTVLDEADDRLRAFKHVAADDAGDALAVRGAIDHQRLG